MQTRLSKRPCKDRRSAVMPRNVNCGRPKNETSHGNAVSTISSTRSARTAGRRKQTQRQQPQEHEARAKKQPKMDLPKKSQGASSKHMGMSGWLRMLLDNGEEPNIYWSDKRTNTFCIDWLHKSNQNFNRDVHGNIFTRWAEYRHSGSGAVSQDLSFLKANFRCALNSLRDVEQLTPEGAKRGPSAKRTFRFLSPNDPNYGRKRSYKTVKSARAAKSKKTHPLKRRQSSPSCSWTSTHDSSSSSEPPSPDSSAVSLCSLVSASPGPVLPTSPSANFTVSSFPQESLGMDSTPATSTLSISPRKDLQGNWTANYLQPIEDFKVADLSFEIDPSGITSVITTGTAYSSSSDSPRLQETQAAAEATAPQDTQEEIKTVQIETNLHQSGATMSRLPNFSELGVPDTYIVEKVHTNERLGCGGNVKIRGDKPKRLPFPEITVGLPNLVPNENQDPNIVTDALPTMCNNDYADGSVLLQSELNVGQTLEVSDESSVNPEESACEFYRVFTPEANDGTTSSAEYYESQEQSLLPAVSAALDTLNSPPCEDFPSITRESHLSQNNVIVEAQPIQGQDFLLSMNCDEEDAPDLFQLGTV
ncbi:interferon regulatory factor [Plakobranchus ocellatus]|uniref:Interferon regulatory factor n=1 Tax=Plakobranchus ocellatus TaxID=259542 RepID=A0AAV4A570_9GAST|nr:interferon regulatory factor [Plakobranchus ocellatus]